MPKSQLNQEDCSTPCWSLSSSVFKSFAGSRVPRHGEPKNKGIKGMAKKIKKFLLENFMII
jgi:hypothetical protein